MGDLSNGKKTKKEVTAANCNGFEDGNGHFDPRLHGESRGNNSGSTGGRDKTSIPENQNYREDEGGKQDKKMKKKKKEKKNEKDGLVRDHEPVKAGVVVSPSPAIAGLGLTGMKGTPIPKKKKIPTWVTQTPVYT